MKKFFVASLALVLSVCASAAKKPTHELVFDASKGVAGSVVLPNGKKVNYTAYTKLYYVTNVEDSTYQYMNVFVPEGASQSTPIFMPNYVGGYMAAEPRMIDDGDASGRALAEGYVVAIPGARGRNSTVTKKGKTIYTGRAPKALLDLKAAVRYLRLFDSQMPGDAEHIITDGTSAGGAMSSLLGSTGNSKAVLDAAVSENVRLLNPLTMMADEGSTVAPHWYIRHGARDRDTSFPVPVCLATRLQNMGKDVDFKLPWNRPHSGDYALNELFEWMKSILK